MATLRGFDSVIDSLLFPQQVSRELYNRQIDLITTRLAPHMRKYARLLKKVHNLDRMTFADLKIAVDPEYDPSVTIEESKQYIEKGLAILGDDYVSMIQEHTKNAGLTLHRTRENPPAASVPARTEKVPLFS